MKFEKSVERQIKNKMEYYKNLDNIEEVPIDILRAMYKDLLQDNYKLDRENQILFESQINSIPKKKVENKIKAYEKLIDDVSKSEHYSHEIPLYRHDISVLQELLEDK